MKKRLHQNVNEMGKVDIGLKWTCFSESGNIKMGSKRLKRS